MTPRILLAIGFGRKAEAEPPRRSHIRYLRREGAWLGRSIHLSPWSGDTFRFGWVLGWNGLFWHRAIAIKGPGYWTYKGMRKRKPYSGPPCWDSFGPFAYLKWRRRGSLRCDRQFCRNMDCTCPHTGLLWPIGFTHLNDCPITIAHQAED